MKWKPVRAQCKKQANLAVEEEKKRNAAEVLNFSGLLDLGRRAHELVNASDFLQKNTKSSKGMTRERGAISRDVCCGRRITTRWACRILVMEEEGERTNFEGELGRKKWV